MSLFFWKKKKVTHGVAIETLTRLELALSKQSKQIQELSKSIRSLEASREIQNTNHLAIKNELNAVAMDIKGCRSAIRSRLTGRYYWPFHDSLWWRSEPAESKRHQVIPGFRYHYCG